MSMIMVTLNLATRPLCHAVAVASAIPAMENDLETEVTRVVPTMPVPTQHVTLAATAKTGPRTCICTTYMGQTYHGCHTKPRSGSLCYFPNTCALSLLTKHDSKHACT